MQLVKTLTASMLLAWGACAQAALFALDADPPFNWTAFVVAKNASQATSIANDLKLPFNTNPTFRVIHQCKPGGWFAFLTWGVNGDGGGDRFAGACNFKSRVDAKKAAITACLKKPGCRGALSGDGGVLGSGFDDPAFNVEGNHAAMQGPGGSNGVIPRYERCTLERYGIESPAVCQGLFQTALDRATNGPKNNVDSVPFDPDHVEPSPWDR